MISILAEYDKMSFQDFIPQKKKEKGMEKGGGCAFNINNLKANAVTTVSHGL